eukprot:EG_transcript_16541
MSSLSKAYPGHDCHTTCGCTLDGGIGPPLFDTVPGEKDTAQAGSRMMRYGPAGQADIGPDVVPNGGAGVAKKLLYSRGDRPWNSTARGGEFGRYPYMAGGYRDGDGDGGRRLKAARSAGKGDSLDHFQADMGQPMKTGKVRPPYTSYPYMSDPTQRVPLGASGLAFKAGCGPEVFDPSIHTGGQMVSDPNHGLRNGYVPRPVGKMQTNLRKKDTFGAYPEHLADPYKDNPLGDDKAKGKRPFLTKTVYGKPNMPIVNVWDPPAGLQTKAGVRAGIDGTTGARGTVLCDAGRLGTTM